MTITTQYAALHVGPSDPLAPRFVDRPPILSIEWACQRCGNSGTGFMPEEHASGACEVVLEARLSVVGRAMMDATTIVRPVAPHFVDGGGI